MFTTLYNREEINDVPAEFVTLNLTAHKAKSSKSICLVSDSSAGLPPTALQTAGWLAESGWEVAFLDTAEFPDSNIVAATKNKSEKWSYVHLKKLYEPRNWHTPLRSRCAYEWLKDKTFDIIIFQHGFGIGHICCMARSLELAFEKTCFVVMPEMPYAKWLQDQGFFPNRPRTDLEIDFFERETVACADFLMAFDRDVYDWMTAAVWKIPDESRLIILSESGDSWNRWLDKRAGDARHPARQRIPVSISVCMATYNRPVLLNEALESLEQQTANDFEVVVIDDGSDDPRVEGVRKKWLDVFKQRKWRWEKQDNQGPAVARNRAAELAKGTHVLFMDDDNLALSDEIEIFMRAAASGCDVLSGTHDLYPAEVAAPLIMARFPARSTLPMKTLGLHWVFYGPCIELSPYINTLGDTNSLFRKEVFHALGGFHGDRDLLHEDWHILLRAAVAGYEHKVIPEILLLYRFHDERRTKTGVSFSGFLSLLKPVTDQVPPHLRSLFLGMRADSANNSRMHPGRYATPEAIPCRGATPNNARFLSPSDDDPLTIAFLAENERLETCFATLAGLVSSQTGDWHLVLVSALSAPNLRKMKAWLDSSNVRVTVVPLAENNKKMLDSRLEFYAQLGQFLPKEKRVITVSDCILVRHDLRGLWCTPLVHKDLAAVSDFWASRMPKYRDECDSEYFSAAIMLIDLDAWRTRSASNAFSGALKSANSQPPLCGLREEAPLNEIFRCRWQALSPIWNCMLSDLIPALGHYGIDKSAAKHITRDPAVCNFIRDPDPWIEGGHRVGFIREYDLLKRMALAVFQEKLHPAKSEADMSESETDKRAISFNS